MYKWFLNFPQCLPRLSFNYSEKLINNSVNEWKMYLTYESSEVFLKMSRFNPQGLWKSLQRAELQDEKDCLRMPVH